MSECGICLECKPENMFKTLSCNHSLCETCYPKLRTNKCPFCRTPFIKESNIIFKTHNNIDLNFFDYDSFLSSRQIRRQRNKRFSQNRGRPRVITNNNPISVFIYDGEINIPIQEEHKHKKNKPTHKKNKKSNRWKDLRNQQNFNII